MDAPEFAKFVETDSARLVAAVKKIGKVELGRLILSRHRPFRGDQFGHPRRRDADRAVDRAPPAPPRRMPSATRRSKPAAAP